MCTFSTSGDVPRVNGQLAVSRAFGDKSLKSHLRSDPDIQDSNVDTNTDILVLASDGLWKVNHFTSETYVQHSVLISPLFNLTPTASGNNMVHLHKRERKLSL